MCRSESMRKESELLNRLENAGFNISTIKGTVKSNERIFIECNNGHITEGLVRSLVRRSSCLRCDRLKLFFESVRVLMDEGYKVLSVEDDYVNTKSKIKYICFKGHEQNSTVSSIRKGCRCNACARIKISEMKKLSYEEVEFIFKNENYKILSDVNSYQNEDTVFTVQCINGHTYDTTLGNFRRGYRCRSCFIDSNRGINSHSWKNGMSTLNNFFRSSINNWKKDSLENSNYRCFISGKNGKFHIHHHKNFSDIVAETMDELGLKVEERIENYSNEEIILMADKCIKKHYEYGFGIVMLDELHALFHSIYGIKNNTMEQVLEFKQDYLEGKYNEYLNIAI